MNDHVPLRVTIHGGRPNIVAAHTIIRPKLFAAEAHVGIVRDDTARVAIRLPVCFRFRKQVPGRAGEKYNPSHEDAAVQCCYHTILSSRSP